MHNIDEKQNRVLTTIAEEAGVFGWEFGIVQNPTDARGEWRWRFTPCRHAPDRHHGGVEEVLKEMRKLNAQRQDIYMRPVQGAEANSIVQYNYFVLDDVEEKKALQIAAQNRALVVRTSAEGGCQVWVFTTEGLTRAQRTIVQQHYAKKIGSDGGAVSGVQLCRMPGFKNHKRGGQWVNVLVWPKGNRLSVQYLLLYEIPTGAQRALNKKPTGAQQKANRNAAYVEQELPDAVSASMGCGDKPQPPCDSYTEKSQSEKDFYFCIYNLKRGIAAGKIIDVLAGDATRKGKYAEDYAARTVAAARKALT